MSAKTEPRRLKPVVLYDHLPGILAGYPAIMCLIFSILAYPNDLEWQRWPISSHMLFWVGISVMIVWYIAFVYNLPKGKFWLIFGLLGTFIGIPIVLEFTTEKFRVFSTTAGWLKELAPTMNGSGWLVIGVIFGINWLANFIWSRTHMKVRIDESGLTINRWGGKGERFELIGLKTENEPLDYLELFIGGIGSLALKTRMGKPIFTMKRVVGLYRTPIFPFFRGKLAYIEDMLSFQGKVVSVDRDERIDAVEAMEGDADADADDVSGDEGNVDAIPDTDHEIEGPDSREIS